ncbi:DUF1501 domain-containing protein [Pedobacter aquatilis]|uniref:DUF1501 domain-containing protein n=1 Tax=Pedobacter aquatilis TaxID=351343 RepID=UPI00292E96AE|nr:DUF1501 domain-containing protein [Pedobacter aquatilis]
MLINRRKFIQASSLATASLMLPKFLHAFNGGIVPQGNKVVVVLQLSGGNDGLNTVISVRNDIYYRERPTLSIQRDRALGLTDEVGLHPALTSFKDLYDDGNLGIMNGVGYANPDRSHFRSMDIWQTGSGSSEYLSTGWLGRYLDLQCKDCKTPTQILEMDDVLSLALKGNDMKGLALKDPRRLYGSSQDQFFRDIAKKHQAEHEQPVDYLYKTMAETVNSAEYIFNQSQLRPTSAAYPKTEIGNNMKNIASLIFSDINTKVYYVSLGSFDTHVNQQWTQQRLFAEMNDAVSAFVKDLKQNNRFDDVLLFSFSEFGRRVAQNASVGTDHGTANNMFMVSGGLKEKGILNALPDLVNLKDGDMQHNVDFKQVYATVLDKWLGVNHKEILGEKYQTLNFI